MPEMMPPHTHTLSIPFKSVEIHSFVSLAADDFKIPFSFARRLRNVCDVF
jgi:hypothetical protein